MKNVIRGILFAAMLLVLSCTQAFAASEDAFKELDVFPELLEKDSTDVVKRDEFAAVASVISGGGVPAATDTAFSDVTAENPYSGAVKSLNEQGILSGVGDGQFAPQEPITYNQVIAVYVKILGYELVAQDWDGYPTGYIRTAKQLDAFKKVSDHGEAGITYGTLWELTDWALESHTASLTWKENGTGFDENLSFSKETPTLMQQSLGLEAYTGIVEDYDSQSYSIAVEITESEYGNTYSEGSKAVFAAAGSVNLPYYNRAVVKLWVFKKGNICSLSLDDNYEIKSGIVYSVNGDDTEGAKYQTGKIREVTLMDDDKTYDIHDDGLKIYYNGESFTGSLDFAGRFVRAILKDDEIIMLETWDVTEGGLVNKISAKSISYLKGSIQMAVNNLDNYANITLFIDGEIRDIKDLKTDSVLDYYKNDEAAELVLFVSERRINGDFRSYNSEDLKIGNVHVKYTTPLYSSVDKEAYSASTGNTEKLLGTKVTGYMDAFGKVRYICPVGAVESNEFIGYITGVSKSGVFREEYELKIVNLDDKEFTEEVFKAAEKIRFEDGLTAEQVYATAKSTTGEGIYRFKKNNDGEISRVEKFDPYYGFATGVCSPSVFTDQAYLYMTVDGKKLYFDNGVRIIGINTADDRFEFCTFKYSELRGEYCSGITVRFFGEEMESDVELMLLCGNIESLRGSTATHGIVTDVYNIVLPNGDDGRVVVVNDKEYTMTAEDAEGITVNTYISFYKKAHSGNSELLINSKFDLTGSMYDWEGLGDDVVMHRGIVKKIDSKRIFFDDGTIYFLRPSGCQFMKSNEKSELSTGARADVLTGMDVIYSLYDSEVGMVIYPD